MGESMAWDLIADDCPSAQRDKCEATGMGVGVADAQPGLREIPGIGGLGRDWRTRWDWRTRSGLAAATTVALCGELAPVMSAM
jgi:hypothetical protein